MANQLTIWIMNAYLPGIVFDRFESGVVWMCAAQVDSRSRHRSCLSNNTPAGAEPEIELNCISPILGPPNSAEPGEPNPSEKFREILPHSLPISCFQALVLDAYRIGLPNPTDVPPLFDRKQLKSTSLESPLTQTPWNWPFLWCGTLANLGSLRPITSFE